MYLNIFNETLAENSSVDQVARQNNHRRHQVQSFAMEGSVHPHTFIKIHNIMYLSIDFQLGNEFHTKFVKLHDCFVNDADESRKYSSW